MYPPFLSVVGAEAAGFVQWQVDSDRVVRRFSERLAEDGRRVPTLVGLQGVRELPAGQTVTVDATEGVVYAGRHPALIEARRPDMLRDLQFTLTLDQPTLWALPMPGGKIHL